ncbi:FMRFamide receptor-like [Elysia marginata]|uniref:FMRFamide receptor-like n=1 Tax=Elysia marginata TaxID=1093978 RepID=A0AAV4GHB5_9GAST|nr:FMRFamide receptor-like [Elysia marginata]
MTNFPTPYIRKDLIRFYNKFNLTQAEIHEVDGIYEAANMFMRVTGLILLVIGVPGNILVISVLRGKSMRRNLTALFLTYLAAFNLLNLLVGLLRYVVISFHVQDIRLHSETLCLLHLNLVVFAHLAANWTILAVGLCKMAYVLVPDTFGLLKCDQQYLTPSALVEKFCTFLVPEIAMFFVNISTIRAYYLIWTKASEKEKKMVRVNYLLGIMLFISDIELLLAEIPYIVINTFKPLLFSATPRGAATYLVASYLSVIGLYSNSAFNCLTYCFFGGHYRRELRRVFRPILSLLCDPESRWVSSDASFFPARGAKPAVSQTTRLSLAKMLESEPNDPEASTAPEIYDTTTLMTLTLMNEDEIHDHEQEPAMARRYSNRVIHVPSSPSGFNILMRVHSATKTSAICSSDASSRAVSSTRSSKVNTPPSNDPQSLVYRQGHALGQGYVSNQSLLSIQGRAQGQQRDDKSLSSFGAVSDKSKEI